MSTDVPYEKNEEIFSSMDLGAFSGSGLCVCGLVGTAFSTQQSLQVLGCAFRRGLQGCWGSGYGCGLWLQSFSGLSMVLITLFSTVLHRFAFSGLPTFVRKTGGLGWEL